MKGLTCLFSIENSFQGNNIQGKSTKIIKNKNITKNKRLTNRQ